MRSWRPRPCGHRHVLGEMKDIIYGRNVASIQHSLQQQMDSAKEALEICLRHYEQSMAAYAKLAEALSFLKLHPALDKEDMMEVVDYPGQDVVSLPYRATFEDDLCLDVEHLPKIQNIAQQVNAVSIGSLLYTTVGHFDSDACTFDHKIHDFKIDHPRGGPAAAL